MYITDSRVSTFKTFTKVLKADKVEWERVAVPVVSVWNLNSMLRLQSEKEGLVALL